MNRQAVYRTLGMLGLLAATLAATAARADETLKVEQSIEVAANPARVWSAIGDFKGLPGWHPAVAQTDIANGEGNRRGAVRTVTTRDGAKIVEELLAYDGPRHSMQYRIIDSPLPVADYVSTLSVERAGNGSRVVWKSTFKRAANAGADVDDAKARNIVAGIYLAGFDGLRKVLGETAQAAR